MSNQPDKRNNLMHHPRIQRMLGGGFIERWGIGILSRVQMMVMRGHKIPADMNLIRRVRGQRSSHF